MYNKILGEKHDWRYIWWVIQTLLDATEDQSGTRRALIGAGETVSAIVSHIQSDQITGHVFSGFKEGLKMA